MIACLSTVGFFAWKILTKEMTPSEEVEACIRKNPIASKELAIIIDKYPSLVDAKLKNQKITVSGILKKALVKGVERHDLILELEGSGKRNLTCTSNVMLSKRLKGVVRESFPCYQKKGREIFLEQHLAAKKASVIASKAGEFLGIPKAVKGDSNYTQMTVAFREMEAATLEGVFQYIRPGSVELEWIQPGSF